MTSVNDELCAECENRVGSGSLYYLDIKKEGASIDNVCLYFHSECLKDYHPDPFSIISEYQRPYDRTGSILWRRCDLCQQYLESEYVIFAKYSYILICLHTQCLQHIVGEKFMHHIIELVALHYERR